MAETAVGLFENEFEADTVIRALHDHSFPPAGIRKVAKPLGVTATTATDTPGVDFLAGVGVDLRSMGASEFQCSIFLDGLRNDGVLVFATGSREQGEAAVVIMDRYYPSLVEEYAVAAPMLPGLGIAEETHLHTAKHSDPSQSAANGARLFTW